MKLTTGNKRKSIDFFHNKCYVQQWLRQMFDLSSILLMYDYQPFLLIIQIVSAGNAAICFLIEKVLFLPALLVVFCTLVSSSSSFVSYRRLEIVIAIFIANLNNPNELQPYHFLKLRNQDVLLRPTLLLSSSE